MSTRVSGYDFTDGDDERDVEKLVGASVREEVVECSECFQGRGKRDDGWRQRQRLG